MVAKLIPLMLVLLALAGCQDSAQGGDLSRQGEQPAVDQEAARNAQTIEQWSQANPNNGAPGHGESSK